MTKAVKLKSVNFGQKVAEFYGLTAQNPARIYFAGLSATNNSDSYEHELDRIISGSPPDGQCRPALRKIGLALHHEIIRQRTFLYFKKHKIRGNFL